MVTFTDLSNMTAGSGIGDFLQLPNRAYPFFWLWIFGAIWLIISFTLYFREKERKGVGNLISSMAVSSFAILMLSTIGTIIGLMSLEIMIYILVFCLLIIGIFFFVNRE